jgi:hypothetical protein
MTVDVFYRAAKRACESDAPTFSIDMFSALCNASIEAERDEYPSEKLYMRRAFDFRELANILLGAFDWDETEEGDDYYGYLYDVLLDFGGVVVPATPDANIFDHASAHFWRLFVNLFDEDEGEDDIMFLALDQKLRVAAERSRSSTSDIVQNPRLPCSLEDVRRALLGAFEWADSPEGEAYWENVHCNLRYYGDKPEFNCVMRWA